MIIKINKITEYGSFSDFSWNTTVSRNGGNEVEFEKLNILYGRNYSGKTTLSRIFRSIETRKLHDKFSAAHFEIEDEKNDKIESKDVADCNLDIRVYNTDFVKENLSWLTQEEDGVINSFAVIGESNIETEKRINKLTTKCGDEECGLEHAYAEQFNLYTNAKSEHLKKENNLEKILRKEAVEIKNKAAKYNTITYDIRSIKKDIKVVSKTNKILDEKLVRTHEATINEHSRDHINHVASPSTKHGKISTISKKLLEKDVKPSSSIKELLENAKLQEWVRDGSTLHRDIRTNCAFCGQSLPSSLWEKLDSHFSKESENLRVEIQDAQALILNEISIFKNKTTIPDTSIYSQTRDRFTLVLSKADEIKSTYINILKTINIQLESRLNNIFTPIEFKENVFNTKLLVNSSISINQLIDENNLITKDLTKNKNEAQVALRLHRVASFINTIDHKKWLKDISEMLTQTMKLWEGAKSINEEITEAKKEIAILKTQLKDERRGAEKVNKYLNHHFGHQALSLVAEDDESGCKFVLKRNGQPAFNLSEGECSLVAFCYYMAKLEEVETQGKNIIYWIDDPISSLDSNHVFFIFSLIESIIAKNKNYEQLFISTHSLDFLKYLKRITKPKKTLNGKSQLSVGQYIIENINGESSIRVMPRYLKNYITEFNYLFDIIYKCSKSNVGDENHDDYYSFGNNLRKFLESYLFYKYPDNSSFDHKMVKFFSDDSTSFASTNRLINEYSHSGEAIDRTATPIEIPEMKSIGQFVLGKIKNKDIEQYQALLSSIEIK